MRGCSWGGVCGCSGGHAWLLRGACVVALGGSCMVAPGAACMVAPRGACTVAPGGHACFFWGGGMCGFFNEIRSMSGQYASYWNAFLLFITIKSICQLTTTHIVTLISESMLTLPSLFSSFGQNHPTYLKAYCFINSERLT